MDDLINQIKKLLYHQKLLTLNEIQLSMCDSRFLDKLISKLSKLFDYNLYHHNNYINKINRTSAYPMFIDNNIVNLVIDGIKINNIIILPINIYLDQNNSHITCFYINLKLNHVLYFDPYGINKKQYNTIKPIIKQFLIENNIIKKNCKFISFNFPIQRYVKDENNIWFYEMSCGVLVGLFTYLYFISSENDNLIDNLIKYCKMIKQKENIIKLKDLMVFVYAAINND